MGDALSVLVIDSGDISSEPSMFDVGILVGDTLREVRHAVLLAMVAAYVAKSMTSVSIPRSNLPLSFLAFSRWCSGGEADVDEDDFLRMSLLELSL